MSGLFVNSLLSAIELIKKCVPDLSWDEIMRGSGTSSFVAIENSTLPRLVIFCIFYKSDGLAGKKSEALHPCFIHLKKGYIIQDIQFYQIFCLQLGDARGK